MIVVASAVALQVVLFLMLAEGLACACFPALVKQTLQRTPPGLLRLTGVAEAALALILWILTAP